MRHLGVTYVSIILSIGFLVSCSTGKQSLEISSEESAIFKSEAQSVQIGNDTVAYEITIIEPGFYNWLQGFARPRGYYTQNFMENRNQIFVTTWNQRFLTPQQFDPLLYEMQIDYDPKIDYGYEVNYILYNYFIFFQRKYNQRLGPFVPRI